MTRPLLIGIALLGLATLKPLQLLAGPEPSAANSAAVADARQEQTGADEAVAMTFIDISGFDEDLSSSMAGSQRKIIVDFPGQLLLSELPPRLDQWLSHIKTTGGKVQARELPPAGSVATRGFLGILIDIGAKVKENYQQLEILKPAQDYHAILEYDKDSGRVTRAVFYRR